MPNPNREKPPQIFALLAGMFSMVGVNGMACSSKANPGDSGSPGQNAAGGQDGRGPGGSLAGGGPAAGGSAGQTTGQAGSPPASVTGGSPDAGMTAPRPDPAPAIPMSATTVPAGSTPSSFVEKDGYIAFEAEYFDKNEGYGVFAKEDAPKLHALCDPEPCDTAPIVVELQDEWGRFVSAGKLIQGPREGARVSYTFTVTTPGEWVLALHTWSSHHLSNGIYVQMDGKPTDISSKITKYKLPKITEWRWFVIDQNSSGQEGTELIASYLANLASGKHTLTLVSSGEPPLIDKVVLMTKKWFTTNTRPTACATVLNICVEKIGGWTTGPLVTGP